MGNTDYCRDCGEYEICCDCNTPSGRQDRKHEALSKLGRIGGELVQTETDKAWESYGDLVARRDDGTFCIDEQNIDVNCMTLEQIEQLTVCFAVAIRAEKRRREGALCPE